MDMRKLLGALLRVHYSVLRLVTAVETVLETDQEMGLIGQLMRVVILQHPPAIWLNAY